MDFETVRLTRCAVWQLCRLSVLGGAVTLPLGFRVLLPQSWARKRKSP